MKETSSDEHVSLFCYSNGKYSNDNETTEEPTKELIPFQT